MLPFLFKNIRSPRLRIFTIFIFSLPFFGSQAFAQAYNTGNMYISGNVALLSGTFTNTATASYLNNGYFYVTGDFTNNQAAMVAGTATSSGTINFYGTSLENINGTNSPYFHNVVITNTSGVTPASSLYVSGNWTNNGLFNNNAQTVTIDGSGTQTLGGTVKTVFNNLYMTNTGTGAAQAQDEEVDGTLQFTSGNLAINSNTLFLNGFLTTPGSGAFTGSSGSNMTLGGSSGGSLGTINFTTGNELLNTFTMNRTGGSTPRAIMGTQMSAGSFVLSNGILATGSNLVTWLNSGGTLTQPQMTYNATSLLYENSFIATCDASGNPVSGGASSTTPYAGNVGFKIKNVTNTDTYFPVGASFNPAGTDPTYVPAPDRMMLNSHYGSPADYTVAVNYGDIGYTDGVNGVTFVVNRVWYVKTSTASDAGAATMKLFYTKRNTTNWPTVENEVEAGFNYGQTAVVSKDYSGNGNNFIFLSSASDYNSAVSVANNYEAYAQYTFGVSQGPGQSSSTNGITIFNRFSIVNPSGIILPVNVVNFKAYQQGSGVQTEWTSVYETNTDHYEVERSVNGTDFITLGSVAALDNGQPSIDYNFPDPHPVIGNNYYRVKVLGKDGTERYTNIGVVNIGEGSPSVMIFPNPVINHNFTLQMNNMPAGKYNLLIYNTLGQLLVSHSIEHSEGSSSQTVYLPAGTAHGVYHVKLMNGSTVAINKMIIVQ